MDVVFADDPDDEEWEDYLNNMNILENQPEYRGHYRAFVPRIMNYVEDIVPLYNESDFIQNFR